MLFATCSRNASASERIKYSCECKRIKEALTQIPTSSVVWTNWGKIDTLKYWPSRDFRCGSFSINGQVETDGINGPYQTTHSYNIQVVEADLQPPGGYTLGELKQMSDKYPRQSGLINLYIRSDSSLTHGIDLALYELGTNQHFTFQDIDNCSVKSLPTGRF